jgi:hypothetical protein
VTIIYLQSKVISLVSNIQPGGPGLCIYVTQWQDSPIIAPGIGFPFVAFYDSQGYDGGILTLLHTGKSSTSLILLLFHQDSDYSNLKKQTEYCFP